MNIAYCAECKPPKVLGAPVGLSSCSHKVGGDVHKGKILVLGETVEDRRGPKEDPQAYLDRLAKKYASRLK